MSTDESTPATDTVEKFARNFRNMGVVEDYEITRRPNEKYDVVAVYTDDRGLSPLELTWKGWDFDIVDISGRTDTGEIAIVFHCNTI